MSGVIEQQEQATGLIGQPVKRVEDARLVSGRRTSSTTSRSPA